MISTHKVHPHDVGLTEGAVRKRRRSKRMAKIMISIALVTAGAGWFIFGTSMFDAVHIRDQPFSRAIVAYSLLIVSSATLVLGFWYILLAQVERLARIVDAAELESPPALCAQCQHPFDMGDRFCRHCGAALSAKP